MIYDLLMIGVGILLTLGTALFVAAEFSYVALDSATLEARVAAGDNRAKQILGAVKNLSTQLSGAQVGITLTTILLGYTTQVTLANLFTRLLGATGLSQILATTLAVIISIVIINGVSMLFGELVPKNVALAAPLQTAGIVTPLQAAFTNLFLPLIKVLNGTANRILRSLGVEPMEELSSARSASELAALVRYSAEEGTLDTSTATLLTKSISMAELTASDVMTHRGRMEHLRESSTAADVVELAKKTGHSRFPVVGDDSDDILGFVSLRRAISVPYERRPEVSVLSNSLISEAPRVPETLALAPLLVELRNQGLQIAVVVDEYGGTSGIVTLEDVVEEIVGEVADEHDLRRYGIRRAKDGAWRIPGNLRPDELLERTGIRVPDDGPYDTVAGLVMYQLKRVAELGDEVTFPGAHLEVTRMEGRRIEQLSVREMADQTAEGETSL